MNEQTITAIASISQKNAPSCVFTAPFWFGFGMAYLCEQSARIADATLGGHEWLIRHLLSAPCRELAPSIVRIEETPVRGVWRLHLKNGICKSTLDMIRTGSGLAILQYDFAGQTVDVRLVTR